MDSTLPSSRRAEHERYLELSRQLGMKTVMLIESSTDDTFAVHVKRHALEFPEQEALMREAYAIWKKCSNPVSDSTDDPV